MNDVPPAMCGEQNSDKYYKSDILPTRYRSAGGDTWKQSVM
jgi:hypothetical protein